MAFWLSQDCIRRGESTDSKTMIPLIQIRVEEPDNGRVVRVGYSICDGYMCAAGGNGTDARLALGAAASLQGKGSRDEVLPIAKKPPAGRFRESVRQIQRTQQLNSDKLILSQSIRRGQFEN